VKINFARTVNTLNRQIGYLVYLVFDGFIQGAYGQHILKVENISQTVEEMVITSVRLNEIMTADLLQNSSSHERRTNEIIRTQSIHL